MQALEVFAAFLKLGLTSFGGPLAHLGYFREAFVVGRRWLSEEAYAALLALAQALPGPTSSQVAMALGLLRAGLPGLLAAWLGFTLPSALLLFLAGVGLERLDPPGGLLAGLKLLALAAVAHAVGGMQRALAPEGVRLALALGSALLLLLWPHLHLPVLLLAGVLGLLLLKEARPLPDLPPQLLPPRVGWVAFVLFLLPFLLLALPHPLAAFLGRLYLAGSLIFGGGHVVLPLLKEGLTPGFLDPGAFLAGYGLAQAVPGPLFSFAAFLGAQAPLGLPPLLSAALALLALFLPGTLLLLAALALLGPLLAHPLAARALAGVNAGVVGLLMAALYDPLFLEAVGDRSHLALGLFLFALLRLGAPPALVALLGATLGAFLL